MNSLICFGDFNTELVSCYEPGFEGLVLVRGVSVISNIVWQTTEEVIRCNWFCESLKQISVLKVDLDYIFLFFSILTQY